MTTGELAKATTTWQQAHFGVVMSGSLQLSCGSSDKNRVGEGAKCCSQEGDIVAVQKFSLDDVKGLFCTTQKVIILPFSAVNVCTSPSIQRTLHAGSCSHGTDTRS